MDAERYGKALDALGGLHRTMQAQRHPLAVIVRQLHSEFVAAVIAEPDGGCPACGAELVQPATGRPRRWCSERCRKRGRKSAA